MRTPEGKVKDKVKEFLHSRRVQSLTHPIYEAMGFYWMPVVSGMGAPFLDFVICYRGRFIAVETKKDDATNLTARQHMICARVQDGGGRAVWGGESVIAQLDYIFDGIDSYDD
jgi:hypothetical protein